MLNVFTGSTLDSYECRADVILVIDNSSSMSEDNSSEIINFVNNIVSELPLSENNARIGYIFFNDMVQSVVS